MTRDKRHTESQTEHSVLEPICEALPTERFARETIINGITEFSVIRYLSDPERESGICRSDFLDWRHFGALDKDIATEQCVELLASTDLLVLWRDIEPGVDAPESVDAATGFELDFGHEIGVPANVQAAVTSSTDGCELTDRLSTIKPRFRAFLVLERYARSNLKVGSRAWLAAMALSARWIERDMFAFGCFVTELRNKIEHERDSLRGRAVKKGAARGGQSRNQQNRINRESLHNEIELRISSGEKISKIAADIVACKNLTIKPSSLETSYRRSRMKKADMPATV